MYHRDLTTMAVSTMTQVKYQSNYQGTWELKSIMNLTATDKLYTNMKHQKWDFAYMRSKHATFEDTRA